MTFLNQKKSKRNVKRKVSDLDPIAAQRRREQTRNAQRAFRQRQEDVVHSLNEQVDQLHYTIEGLNNAFLYFTSILATSRWLEKDASVTSELRNTIRTFIKLTQPREEDTRRVEEQASQGNANKDTESGGGPHYPEYFPLATRKPNYSAVDKSGNRSVPESTRPPSGTSMRTLEPKFPSIVADTDFYDAPFHNTNCPSPYFNLSTIKSISWQPLPVNEVSFARRLHRAAYEEGYRIVRNAEQDFYNYQQVFCRMLESHTRDTLFWYLTKALHENLHGVLEPPEATYLSNDVEAKPSRWLNATEVYHYFKSRGVDFDESPMFAEIKNDGNSQTNSSSFGSKLTQSTALDSPKNLSSYSDPFTFFPFLFVQNVDHVRGGSADVANPQAVSSENRLLVDVAKLISEIVLPSQTQCRGRNPVFKKEDLDRAMRRSMIESH